MKKELAVAVSALSILSACGSEESPAGGAGAPGAGANGGVAGSSAAGGSGGSGASSGNGGSDASAGTSASGGVSGGGGSGGASRDGGSDASDAAAPPSVTGPAGRSSGGVLTNHPEFQFMGTDELVMVSAYFLLETLPNRSYLQIWGDIENRGQRTLCILLGDIAINGTDILTVADGPAYDVGSSVTSNCLTPGAKGAFNSIEEVSDGLLDGAANVVYSFTGLELTPAASRPPDEPAVLQPRIGSVTGGWGVFGRIQTRAHPIYNFGIHVYARDTSGLLFDTANAYPGDLETLAPSTQMEFETFPVEHGAAKPIDGPFAGFELYTSFIEGMPSAALEQSARSLERSRREARVMALGQDLYAYRLAAKR